MRSRGVWSFMGATVVMGAWALAWAPVAGQAPAASARKFEPPRLSDGKPDLQGIWQVRNTAYADLEDHPARLLGDKKSARLFYPAGLSVVEGREIPYRPEALATKLENFRNQETADPMAKCYLPGVPRVMYLPLPFQLFQTSRFITIVPEHTHSVRTIFVDGARVEGVPRARGLVCLRQHDEGAASVWWRAAGGGPGRQDGGRLDRICANGQTG